MSNQNILMLLKESAELFRTYEQSHRARGPEHLTKAERNADIAGRIEQSLDYIRQNQWEGWQYDRYGNGAPTCEWCGNFEIDGHRDDCELAAIIVKETK